MTLIPVCGYSHNSGVQTPAPSAAPGESSSLGRASVPHRGDSPSFRAGLAFSDSFMKALSMLVWPHPAAWLRPRPARLPPGPAGGSRGQDFPQIPAGALLCSLKRTERAYPSPASPTSAASRPHPTILCGSLCSRLLATILGLSSSSVKRVPSTQFGSTEPPAGARGALSGATLPSLRPHCGEEARHWWRVASVIWPAEVHPDGGDFAAPGPYRFLT